MSVKMSTLVKLNSVRQNVVVELEKSYSNADWVNEVYDAINDAFFESLGAWDKSIVLESVGTTGSY